MREIDDLVNVFVFWKKSGTFDISALHENRLRKLYGMRWDSRINLIDWDYNMKLCDTVKYFNRRQVLFIKRNF